jgi:hypothetical protein
MDQAFADAARLMLEGWYYLPYWLVIDLTLYHLYLYKLDT